MNKITKLHPPTQFLLLRRSYKIPQFYEYDFPNLVWKLSSCKGRTDFYIINVEKGITIDFTYKEQCEWTRMREKNDTCGEASKYLELVDLLEYEPTSKEWAYAYALFAPMKNPDEHKYVYDHPGKVWDEVDKELACQSSQ